METLKLNGIEVFYEAGDRQAAQLIGAACQKTSHLLKDRWDLQPPQDCRVYVMNSWSWYMWHSAPGLWKLPLVLTFPLWVGRIKKTWPIAGGWEQQYGKRHTIGVKPPQVLEKSDRSIGARVFVEQETEEKVASVTCHELTHAFVSQLRLPNWFKEGLSMLAVDLYFERETVLRVTLESIREFSGKYRPEEQRRIDISDPDGMVYLYVRGYWITRYIWKVQPDLISRLLAARLPYHALETQVANSLGLDRDTFWEEIDNKILDYFN